MLERIERLRVALGLPAGGALQTVFKANVVMGIVPAPQTPLPQQLEKLEASLNLQQQPQLPDGAGSGRGRRGRRARVNHTAIASARAERGLPPAEGVAGAKNACVVVDSSAKSLPAWAYVNVTNAALARLPKNHWRLAAQNNPVPSTSLPKVHWLHMPKAGTAFMTTVIKFACPHALRRAYNGGHLWWVSRAWAMFTCSALACMAYLPRCLVVPLPRLDAPPSPSPRAADLCMLRRTLSQVPR